MSQEVVIQIRLTLPDGASYQIVPEATPDFEREPLPPEASGATSWAEPEPSARRGIAIQPGVVWAVGQVHMAGHQPLKLGQKGGLFCPSKVGTNPDGSAQWCSFRA